MSKSAAKKFREKRIREGKLNPVTGRSPFTSADLRTRMTKTKQEMLQQGSRKHKNRLLESSREDSFFMLETA
ncbi:hypothetical protein [Paenibacillus physcomitrellae]|uniref:Uncharacterized protein n=1 Tax=Paenibacillus physcomitrellae TaxID=1619311 RepID=A0ABQ1G552_9BACL|nr:hypothetical protein [Paenibacillus physcomitrellae]GGA37236.1 hypothetical protein GCM10010917_23000 [Paenibacillus physcomitrellae]